MKTSINPLPLNKCILDLNDLMTELGFGEYYFLFNDLTDLLASNQDKFVEKINSVEFWGGSGAVWEIEITDPEKASRFNNLILLLLNEMKAQDILGKRASSVRKVLLRQR